MRLFTLSTSLILACILLTTPQAHAQTNLDLKVGPRVAVDVADIDETAIGGTVRVFSGSSPFQASGAFDVYASEGDATIFTADLNLHYLIALDNVQRVSPYVGAGGGVTRVSGREGAGSETDLGVNLVGGAEIDMRFITLFAQSQITLGDMFDRLGLSAGLLVNL